MKLADSLREYIAAAFPGIWIESHEPQDAVAEIGQLCRDEGWSLSVWDLEEGLRVAGQPANSTGPSAADPLAAVRALPALAEPGSSSLLILQSFHRFLGSVEIIQALAHQLAIGKENRTFVLILAPVVQLPIELAKQFVVIEHALPDREQLAQIAREVATQEGELPTGSELSRLLDAAAGLTRLQMENACALGVVRHHQLRAQTLWELKAQSLQQEGLVRLHRGEERFADLGGLTSLKTFCQRALRSPRHPAALARPRGVLLLSPPGCGKSAFCKALGHELNLPTLILDLGSLLGSLVGQSEANLRNALKVIDRMAPAIVFLDEIEKAFAGVGSGGQSDGGISNRLFGHFLTWLNDRESQTFVVATANDISKLPPEFARAERFDAVFFVDLPDFAQRAAIWRQYCSYYQLELEQTLPADDGWSGAEIKACCRLAALLDVPLVAAAQNIVPISRTSAEAVERLRQWASGRCLNADQPGLYTATRPINGNGNGRRRVARGLIDPQAN